MKFALMSDLHQDFRYNGFDHDKYIDADVIIIAGDLQEGDGIRSLVPYIKKRQRVIFVPGNHEYYNREINSTRLQIRNSGFEYGIDVLDRNVIVIDGVRFIGCTLWTDFRLYGEPKELMCKLVCNRDMTDYHVIKSNETDNGRFTPVLSQQIHYDDVAWLHTALDERFNGPTVVITHHAPSFGSVDAQYRSTDNFLNAAFASNLENFIMKFSPEYWLHGHVHNGIEYTVLDSRIICNPRGYPGEYIEYKPRIVEIS